MTVPKNNCLKCHLYDFCEQFDDGDCPMVNTDILLGNKRPHSIMWEHAGHKMSGGEWADLFGIKRRTFYHRLKNRGIGAIREEWNKKYGQASGK